MRIRSLHDLAATAKGRRKDLGLSQAALAAKAGVSRQWVYAFEAGKPTAELHAVLRVLDALDLALSLDVTTSAAEAAADLDAILRRHTVDG